MKRPTLNFEEQLSSIPVRNEKVTIVPSDRHPDTLIAEVTLRYEGWLRAAKKLLNPRPVRRLELAGLTRELYEKLDGARTVENLIDELAESEKLTFFEARAFVVQYLKGLMERGLIVVVADAVTQAAPDRTRP